VTTLLVASTGGHLAQLYQLRRRLVSGAEPVLWATFDTPQSRSLLAGERVVFVPYVAPRDWRRVLGNSGLAWRVLVEHDVRELYTTGSGIALTFVPLARARGARCHYIESAARSQGPSVTGRLVARVPGVRAYTQYPGWASRRWQHSVTVFDDFCPAAPREPRPLKRLVVTLGTIKGYGFRSLIERLLTILPPDVEVTWQVGDTDVSGLPIQGRVQMPQDELLEACRQADVVVAHSGVGSALGALQIGAVPILVPRRHARGEHIDDHQTLIAQELARRGLALHREVDQLTLADLEHATRLRVAMGPSSGTAPA
jgi:UDP-N-acetylglucosamine--N-acetylmuramyl-(pentapeptide) pyrophosphoryl-undecaprenol N-acetylglucosamine transferase